MPEVREQPVIAFPRISREVLDGLMEERKRRDNFKVGENFAIAQPHMVDYVLSSSRNEREAMYQLSAMEFFARALQLQMQRGA